MASGYDSDFVDGDHLRNLLDQRAARAGFHGRFPSLSEVSDSPSIYSHAFSPRPGDRVAPSGSYHSQYHAQPRQAFEPMSPMSDRQRLAIPGTSSLDLDEDPRNSVISEMADDDLSEDDTATEETAEEETEVHRVSTYGPKMTVHSRAPWEVEDDALQEMDQPDSAGLRSAFKFAKRDAVKKPWGRDGRTGTRPSLESLQSRGKQSFDTTSSQTSGGALLCVMNFLYVGFIGSFTDTRDRVVRLHRLPCHPRPWPSPPRRSRHSERSSP